MNEYLVVAILFGLVFLRAVAVGMMTLLVIHPVRVCPACLDNRTVPVRKEWLRFTFRRYEWRWCMACGWEGLSRTVPVASARQEAEPGVSPPRGAPGSRLHLRPRRPRASRDEPPLGPPPGTAPPPEEG